MLAHHNEEMTTSLEERRARARTRSFKQARILTLDNKSVFDATLKNVTAYGATLSMALTERVPENFKLHIVHDDVMVSCQVKWRKANSLGVAF